MHEMDLFLKLGSVARGMFQRAYVELAGNDLKNRHVRLIIFSFQGLPGKDGLNGLPGLPGQKASDTTNTGITYLPGQLT